MNTDIILAFLFGMIILAATPGPGVVASISRAVSDGFKSSLHFIGGLIIGDIIFLLMAFLGLSAISKLMGELFLIIRIIGGLYLVFLGLSILLRKSNLNVSLKVKETSIISTWISGLLLTLGNPKPILFYASVLPTIINMREVKEIEILVMVLLIAAVSFIVLGTYCYLASLSRNFTTNSTFSKYIIKGSGLVMAASGLYVILKKE